MQQIASSGGHIAESVGRRAKAREQTELFTGVVYTRQIRTLLLFSLLPPSFSHSLRNSLRPMPLFWGELGAGSLVREKASGLQPAATGYARRLSLSRGLRAYIAYISRVYTHVCGDIVQVLPPGRGGVPSGLMCINSKREDSEAAGRSQHRAKSTGATPRSLAQIAAWHTGHVGCRPLAPAASAWMAKGTGIGDCGEGQLKHPRRWLGGQAPGGRPLS